ncbi:hypothetical protein NEAUS03_0169 [Nematocida ausubeli]|nr:hypothetical protein NEAUS03_0169 [Nematocida ausubeli]
MTYYTKTSERIKAHTIAILYLVIGICMIFGTHAANNQCSYFGTVEIEELFENIDNNDLISAMPNEDFNRMLELLNESSASNDTEPNLENHASDTHYQIALEQKTIVISTFYVDDFGDQFYIDDKGYSICMYLTTNMVFKDNILYNVYIDKFGNQIHIDSSIRPSAFNIDNLNIEDISSQIPGKQEESIINNSVKETILNCKRDSTSTSSDDNLKTKRCKSIKSTDSYLGGAKILIESKKYQNACTHLKPYKYEAQSDTTRDKPHGFSYLFTKGGMDNGNIKCKCSIRKNYKNQYEFWDFLTSICHNSLAEKIKCINNLANKIKAKEDKNIARNGYYYYLFLEDLKNYIETHIDIDHISATYDYTDSSKNNICSKSEKKPETLGEIYEETQTDLKWWANSMSIISAKTEEMMKECSIDDAALKEKLHFILKLPEILRDLVLITPEILVKTKREMETSPISEARKAFCIIEYLYYLVNNDSDKANIAYTKVQKIWVNEKHIYTCSTIVVYSLVYNVFCSFYQCAPSTCVADFESEEGKAEKKETRIKRIFQSHCPYIPNNGVFRLHGKRAIVKSTLGKYDLYETISLTSDGSNSMVINQQNQIFLKIAYDHPKHHYHVQLVDNIRHTVKLIPIPYPPYCEDYNSRDGSIQRKTHSIQYIVEYIKSIMKSTYPKKNSEFNVYPFKYKRSIRKWLLIDENCTRHRVKELDKSLDEMNAIGCDVVFYYIEEDIIKNYFKCVDFQILADPNSKTPQIPLFLTNFMMISTIISPYIFINGTCIQTEEIWKSNPNKNWIEPTKIIIDKSAPSQNSSAISPSINESQSKKSYINYYYSDFLVRDIKDYAFCTAECFSTGISLKLSENPHQPSTDWYTQIKRSIREYTNYCFRISAAQKLLRESLLQDKKEVAPTVLDILQRESLSGDKVTYGLCIYTSLDGKEVAVPIMCEKMRRLLGTNIDDGLKSKYANWKSNILPPQIDIKDIKEDTHVFITAKTFNYTQANLGMHYDIIAALFHNNSSAPIQKSKPAQKPKRKPKPALTPEPATTPEPAITPEPKSVRNPSSNLATRKSSRTIRARVIYTE